MLQYTRQRAGRKAETVVGVGSAGNHDGIPLR